MKNFILTLMCTFFAYTFASAQVTERGNFLIGGTLGFSTATSSVKQSTGSSTIEGDGTQATQVNIAPNIGYFFANNFALGIGLDYTLNTTSEPEDFNDPNSEELETIDSDLLFGPFARYYFPIGEDKAFFLESTFGFGNSIDEFQTSQGSQTTATNVFALGVGPGFTIFSRDAIGIEALLKYNYATSNTDIDFGGIETEIKTFTNQFDFSVGFQFYFTRVAAAGR